MFAEGLVVGVLGVACCSEDLSAVCGGLVVGVGLSWGLSATGCWGVVRAGWTVGFSAVGLGVGVASVGAWCAICVGCSVFVVGLCVVGAGAVRFVSVSAVCTVRTCECGVCSF